MPYGLPKDIGGDSPANVKWMEKCVSDVKSGGKSKSSAVAICKSQLIKKRRKNKESELEDYNGIDSELIDEYLSKKFSFIRFQTINNGLTFKQAEALFEKKIIQDNYTF